MTVATWSVKMNWIKLSINSKQFLVINQGTIPYFLPFHFHIVFFHSSENKPARSQLIVIVAHNDDPTDTMIVQFPDQPKIGVDRIKDYFKKMQEESIPHSILVVQIGLTPSARDVCNDHLLLIINNFLLVDQ